jgi:para-aminobenzoate synthetase component 1
LPLGAKAEVTATAGNAFEQLAIFRKDNPGFITGFFTYDLKNEVESLTSSNIDNLNFPDLYFFAPETVISIKGNEVNITGNDAEIVSDQIELQELSPAIQSPAINLHPVLANRNI